MAVPTYVGETSAQYQLGAPVAGHQGLEFRGIEGMKEYMSSPRDSSRLGLGKLARYLKERSHDGE